MRRLMPVFAVLALLAAPSAARAQQEEESKLDRTLKALNKKIDQLQKQVQDLTRKLEEAKPVEKIDKIIDRLVEKLGGKDFGLDKLVEKAEKMLPELPGGLQWSDLPAMLEGMDWEAMVEPLIERLEAELGEFFDSFDGEQIFKQIEKLFKKGEAPRGEEI